MKALDSTAYTSNQRFGKPGGRLGQPQARVLRERPKRQSTTRVPEV
jgi:hypothetical protein